MNNLVLSLAPKFVKLQTLILRQDKPQLEDNAVDAIANHCHELQELDLSKSLKLTDRSLYALAHGCPNLTKLNLSGCTSFSDKAIAYLTRSCRNLKVLNLCGCVNAVSDYTLEVDFAYLSTWLFACDSVGLISVCVCAGYWEQLQPDAVTKLGMV